VGSRGLIESIKAVSRSITVCRTVGVSIRGSKRGQGIEGRCSRSRGSRFKGRGFRKSLIIVCKGS
jgi:hypothetical protein